MKICIQDIKDVPTLVAFDEDAAQLNALLQHGTRDYRASDPIGVSVSYYRAGMDVFLDGKFWADLEGTCSRCLTEYPFQVAENFSLVLVPVSELGPGREERSSRELHADDLALCYYQGEEVDLSPQGTRFLERGDCVLVEGFRHKVLPAFSHEIVSDRTACVPHQAGGTSPRLRVRVLRAEP